LIGLFLCNETFSAIAFIIRPYYRLGAAYFEKYAAPVVLFSHMRAPGRRRPVSLMWLFVQSAYYEPLPEGAVGGLAGS
jgi:hypothetical protein